MAQFVKHFTQDLQQDLKIRQCGTLVFNADALSNVITVDIYDGGEPAELSGTVVGAVICPDGATVPIDNGSFTGNRVTMALTAACFAVTGQIGVGIQIVDGDVKTTVLKAVYNVERFETDNVIDPDSRITLSVSDLIDDIAEAVASIPADYSDLLAAVAPTFSTGTSYAAGAYVWYDGSLYRFTTAHAAGSWTGTDAEAAVFGTDMAGLSADIAAMHTDISALNGVIFESGVNLYDPSLQTSETISPHYYVNGVPYSSTQFDNAYHATALIPIEPNTTYTVGLVGASRVNPWNTATQRGWSYDANGDYISGSNWQSNTFTTPENAAYIRFNYYCADMSLNTLNAKCMLVKGSALPEEYSPYVAPRTLRDDVEDIEDALDEADLPGMETDIQTALAKATAPLRAIVNADGTAVTVISKYSPTADLAVTVGTGGGNGLVDFRRFALISNSAGELSPDATGAVEFLSTSSDWHAPFIVKAKENADGGHPTTQNFTGGSHQYNNSGSGSTPTARVANISFRLDNRALTANDNKTGFVLCISWDNYVQGYNTSKEDGTGREILKEEHTLIYDGQTWESYVVLVPLEDIYMYKWYGFQINGLNATAFSNISYVGGTNRAVYPYTQSSTNCGDKITRNIECYGSVHKAILRIDPNWDVGRLQYIGNASVTASLFTNTYGVSGKAYAYLMDYVNMDEGLRWYAHATFIFESAS